MFRQLLILSLVLTLLQALGCAVPYTIQAPFRPSDWEIIHQPGDSEISGQAILRTRGGAVQTCAGAKVILMPKNAYTQEFLNAEKTLGQSVGSITNLDPRILQYSKVTVCRSQGDFKFTGLPEGRWILLADVTWETGDPYKPTQGGFLFGETTTRTGETTNIVVTRDGVSNYMTFGYWK